MTESPLELEFQVDCTLTGLNATEMKAKSRPVYNYAYRAWLMGKRHEIKIMLSAVRKDQSLIRHMNDAVKRSKELMSEIDRKDI